MPEMDGYTFIHEIRSRDAEHGGTVPAIAQTGYVTPEDRERALAREEIVRWLSRFYPEMPSAKS